MDHDVWFWQGVDHYSNILVKEGQYLFGFLEILDFQDKKNLAFAV